MFESVIVLSEDKHEVFLPVALKSLGYFLFRRLALDVSQFRKFLGVTFTSKNGLDDTYAGFSRNVEQDKRKFYIHLLHGFLHMQDYA